MKNEIYATYKFWNRNRIPGESLEKWINDFKILVADCNFQDQRTPRIRGKIVLNLEDDSWRERLIEQGTSLTLDKCIEACQTVETSKARTQAMKSVINVVKSDIPQPSRQPARRTFDRITQPSTTSPRIRRNCKYCGKHHELKKCPAYGKTCSLCHKLNHFASVCQSRNSKSDVRRHIRNICPDDNVHSDAGDMTKTLRISTIHQYEQSSSTITPVPFLDGNDNKSPVMCKLDTGADTNVISVNGYNSLCLGPLRPCKIKLYGFGDSTVNPLGVATINCFDKFHNCFTFDFFKTDVIDLVILGAKACFTLGLLKRIDVLSQSVPLTLSRIYSEYAGIFTGIGTYEKEYHIRVQDGAKGVVQPSRKIPFAIGPHLKTCRDKLRDQGIIADVVVPTDWVNNLVIVTKKDNSLRLS